MGTGETLVVGAKHYDELSRRGNFSIYLKMVDDLGRTEFLSKTGSVTVFVADDDTYRLISRRTVWTRTIFLSR